MDNWTLLYHVRIGVRPREIAPCYEAIGRLADRHPGRVIFCEKDTPLGYAEDLRDYWHVRGDLLSVEHDMEITEKQVRELLNCPEPACAFVYWIFAASSNKPEPFPTATQEYSAHAAPGFCRLKESVRRGTFPIDHWSKVEWHLDRIVRRTAGRWHNHGPAVPHHHGMYASERETYRVPDGHMFAETVNAF